MTAKKARFFRVRVVDGHGPKERIVAAFSRDDLLAQLEIPENEKLLPVEHLDHHFVQALPCDDNEVVEFLANVNGKEVRVGPRDQGYAYLRQQFSKQVRDVDNFLWSRHGEDA